MSLSHRVRLLLVLALLVVAYHAIVVHPFVYEDVRIQPTSRWGSMPGRWLVGMTWSRDPRVVHATNLALHVTAGLLTAMLAAQLGIAAWWLPAAIVWLHPIASEAVAYGAARGELLVAVGALLACVSATVETAWAAVGVLAGLAVAIWSKETGVIVAPLLLLVASARGRLTAVLTPALAVWAAVVARYASIFRLMAFGMSGGVSAARGLRLEAAAVWTLAALTVYPRGLSIEHDYAQVAVVWPAIGLVLLVVALGWSLHRQRRAVTFGIVWTVLAVTPRFVVRDPLAIFNERHWYVPLIGVALAVTGALEQEGRVAAS